MAHERITGPNTYKRLLVESDGDILETALSDWYLERDYPHAKGRRVLLKRWLRNNQASRPFQRQIEETDAYWATLGYFLNTDDTCVGLSRQYFANKTDYQSFSAIDPAHRGNKYWTEQITTGLKYIFTTLGCDKCVAKIPVSGNPPVNHLLDSLFEDETTIRTGYARHVPIDYKINEITKAQWEAWMDLAENADKKSMSYEHNWEYPG